MQFFEEQTEKPKPAAICFTVFLLKNSANLGDEISGGEVFMYKLPDAAKPQTRTDFERFGEKYINETRPSDNNFLLE